MTSEHNGDARLDNPPSSAEECLAHASAALRRGELLLAYDFASQALTQHPDNHWLKHQAVLALARAGATEQAWARYEEYQLAGRDEEDIRALGARLHKDFALMASSEERRVRAAAAANAYEAVFRATGGYYPCINAATMRLLAGDAKGSAELARTVLRLCDQLSAQGAIVDYFHTATRAEACLLLGDHRATEQALAEAGKLHGGDFASVATTRKQLRLICAILGLDDELVEHLPVPRIIHYCGHMITAEDYSGQFSSASESTVADRIRACLAEKNVAIGYGSLACGADILFAEALLDRNAELHLVLPFSISEFKQISVVGGDSWLERFDTCLRKAASTTYATSDSYLGHDVLFTYATQLAVGLALLRSSYLDTRLEQVVVWDGKPATGLAGTASDVALAERIGIETTVIDPGPPATGSLQKQNPDYRRSDTRARVIRPMLFGDVKGFSKLTESQLMVFVSKVLGEFGKVVDGYGDSICFSNTWGDGIFLVFSDVGTAARCALDLQTAMRSLQLDELGLSKDLSLRLGGHAGPVFEDYDPILKRVNFFGSQVSRTARIEPVTPEGQVFVTEQFAAFLALEKEARFVCDYVGHMDAAKGYGSFRMYSLRDRSAS